MTKLTSQQRTTANWLLQHSKGRAEDAIRSKIQSILDSLDIENEAGYEPPSSGGPSDIYLPRRRTFIEVKAVGGADDPHKPQPRVNNETPKQQLERYLRAEIEYELGCLALEGDTDRPWVGILTDGRVWHIWKYAHQENAPSARVARDYRPKSAEELLDRLRDLLEGGLVGKPWIPADPVSIFEPYLEELRAIHAELRGPAARRTQTKRDLWLDMLRTSSMEPESEAATQRLFVAHSFLVALARGVVYALENGQRGAADPKAEEILGDGFVAWVIDTPKSRQWANRLLKKITTYEWRRRPGDVLRPLYEQFVEERDRKVFGEFYTPDWLAELIAQEVCDDAWCEQAVTAALSAHRKGTDVAGIGVLDPTCGSGTFLYYAAKRLLKALEAQYVSDPEKAAAVCLLVHGIDIHPVAAEIARATLMRTLPAEPPRGKNSLRIHEGDALMLHGDEEDSLFRPGKGEIRISTPGGEEIYFPKPFAERPTFADHLRRLIESVIHGTALPMDILVGLSRADKKLIRQSHATFQKVVDKEGNSVWAWYIRNITGPYRLSEKKIDRIVANPPWVKMADIQVPRRKQALKAFAERKEIDLWAGGRQAPHLDIAQLFIKQCRQLYLAAPDENPAAWLVKKSALRGGNWQKFRDWHRTVCTQTVDLEKLMPFGGGDARRSCVLFEQRSSTLDASSAAALVADKEGKKPAPTQRLSQIRNELSFRPAPAPVPQASSEYVNPRGVPLCRQGATITPKVLTIFKEYTAVSGGEEVTVVTLRSDKADWKDIPPQTGRIPNRWKRPLITSVTLLPFALNASPALHAIVPLNDQGALEDQADRLSPFWHTLDGLYKDGMGEGKRTPKRLIDQIDFSSKLRVQLEHSAAFESMVIYPTSGDIMRACRQQPSDPVLGHSLYRIMCESEEEAAYLVALLNAPCLNRAFLESRTSGRHFAAHPWRKVPIHRFNENDSDHAALTQLTVRAEAITENWLAKPEAKAHQRGQVALSKRIRALLKQEGVLAEIDRIARRLLPEQAQPE